MLRSLVCRYSRQDRICGQATVLHCSRCEEFQDFAVECRGPLQMNRVAGVIENCQLCIGQQAHHLSGYPAVLNIELAGDEKDRRFDRR